MTPDPFSLRCLRSLLFNLFLFAITTPLLAQPAASSDKSAVLAPFLDDQTLLVARVDLSKLDPAALSATLSRLAPDADSQFARHVAALEQRLKAVQQKLAASGVSELYLVFSLLDLPKEPFFFVAPLKTGGDPAPMVESLRSALGFQASAAKEGSAVVGTAAVVERLKNLAPAHRPEFSRGLERAGDAPLQIVLAPSDDTRRVFREMLPRLPEEIGGGSGKMLADGLLWATLTAQYPPRVSLSLTIQARDADAAAALRGMIVSAGQLLTRHPEIRKHVPEIDELARLLTPRLSGERLTLSLTEESGNIDQALKFLAAPLQAARTSAGRAQSTNNLKQLGLALHNYHDVHGHLPPQAIRNKDGKALLSWRVAFLPFVDAGDLYKEFRLDEPWDSDHNQRLIAKMPAAFASPNLGDERIAKGLTSYLAPLTRQPPAVALPLARQNKTAAPGDKEMIFDRPQGIKIADISDGTSNTILIVEANPQSAVIWTKPSDLVIDLSEPAKDLRGQPGDGFSALFGDGSVHFLKSSLDAATFRRLFQMNDGEPIGQIH
jgi:hypothetical protein